MKKKKAGTQLPPMELAIMNVLWENGPLNVQQVQERLPGEPAYTTVQTILNTMEKKGRTRRKLQGKAYVYRAVLSRDVAMKSALRDMVDRMFGGSVESLLMNLLKHESLDAATFEKLRKAIAERETQS